MIYGSIQPYNRPFSTQTRYGFNTLSTSANYIMHHHSNIIPTTPLPVMSNHSRVNLLVLVVVLLCAPLHARVIYTSADLVSDGLENVVAGRNSSSNVIRMPVTMMPFWSSSSSDTCDETYGFMPCTTTIVGNIFLILVYGFLMYTAATYLSTGSELLLEILGPGIIGGLFLPMLGALPDAMLILVSGLSGSTSTAQEQVSVGMGLLAGSTVMLLTAIWGSCVIVGRCDIENSVAVDSRLTKGFSLVGTGVSVDVWTKYAAMIMIISVIPFIIVQIPQILGSSSGKHLAVLISLIVSVVMLISYCLYQIFQPKIQRRRLAYVKHKHVISGLLRHFKKHALGKLIGVDGKPDPTVIEKLFLAIDSNGDGYLSAGELKALVIGIEFEEIDLDQNDVVLKIMTEFDTSRDHKIDLREFGLGIAKWLNYAKSSVSSDNGGPHTIKYLDEFHRQTVQEHALLGDQSMGGEQSDEVTEGVENARTVSIKAGLLLLLGTAIAAAFADPLVDAVDNFSDATGIPSFFISFIALPLATNSSEAVSAIIFASRKKLRTGSLTFSELYGAVTMNNLLCLAVFLALVYVRGLTWDFSAEVLVILIVCIIMGVFGSFRTTFLLWTSSLAFFLYPFSLALVYVLDYVLGWS